MSEISIRALHPNYAVDESCPPGQERYPLFQPLDFFQANSIENYLLRNIETTKKNCLDLFKRVCFSVLPTENQATALLDQCAFEGAIADLPSVSKGFFEVDSIAFRDFFGADNTADYYLGTTYLRQGAYPLFQALTTLNLTPDTQTVLKIKKLVLQENNFKDAQLLLKDITDKKLADYARFFIVENKAENDCNPQELDPLLDGTDTSIPKKLCLKTVRFFCSSQNKNEFAEKYNADMEKLLQEWENDVVDFLKDLQNRLIPRTREKELVAEELFKKLKQITGEFKTSLNRVDSSNKMVNFLKDLKKRLIPRTLEEELAAIELIKKLKQVINEFEALPNLLDPSNTEQKVNKETKAIDHKEL